MTNPTRAEDAEIASIVRGLSPAMREAVLDCRRKTMGASGVVLRFQGLRGATRLALVTRGIAEPWGQVSADLTPLGIAVRAALLENAHVEG